MRSMTKESFQKVGVPHLILLVTFMINCACIYLYFTVIESESGSGQQISSHYEKKGWNTYGNIAS